MPGWARRNVIATGLGIVLLLALLILLSENGIYLAWDIMAVLIPLLILYLMYLTLRKEPEGG